MAAVASSAAGQDPAQALTLDTASAAHIGARNEAAKLAALQAQAGLGAHLDAPAVAGPGGPLYAQQTMSGVSSNGFGPQESTMYGHMYDARAAAMEGLDPNMAGQSMSLTPGQYVGGYDGEYGVQYGGGEYAGGEYEYDDEEMGEEDDYDDEDDLSSSPSIPDENIDFDLVYALHNFIATVEGQATVQKGNSLTLLDDSNSYWWLVRVLPTQEVGYIPAENIESPFERLARLNKHRNVDLSSATPADQVQVQENVQNSYLSKSREERVQILPSSGKLSALSRRLDGAAPVSLAGRRKSAVVFGNSTVLELSDHEEWSETDDEGYDDEYGEGVEEEQGEYEEEELTPEERLAWEQQQHAAYLQQQQQLAHYATYGHVPDTSQDSDVLYQAGGVQHGLDPFASQQAGVDPQQEPSAAGHLYLSPEHQQYHGQQPVAQQQMMAEQQQPQQGEAQQTAPQDVPQSELRSDLEARGLPAGQSTAGARFSPDPRDSSPSQDLDLPSRGSAGSLASESSGSTATDRPGKRRSNMFGLFSRHKKDQSQNRASLTGSVRSQDASADEMTARPPSISVSRETPQLALPLSPTDSAISVRSPRSSQQPDARHLSIHGGVPSSGSGGFSGSGRPRPGSLIVPGGDTSVPMLNVLRVFAAPDLESNSTYKTVLLNETTTANEIVRQALQRFGIGRRSMQSISTAGESSAAELDFALLVRGLDGEERVLAPDEVPLKVYEHITEHEANTLMPSVRRSSVGSISSVASNLSAKSAITRLNHDFSDDHAVKFFLTRRAQSGLVTSGSGMLAADITSPTKSIEADTVMRFGVRVLIFPDELPRSLVFDPSSSSIVRRSMLSGLTRHGSSGSTSRGQSEVNTAYREKVLAIPRQTTVAEVIELALEKFGVPQGVAEGGDEEDSHRHSGAGGEGDEVSVPYGLTLDVGHGEQHLRPSSAVYDAFNSPPALRNVPRDSSAGIERRSLDSTAMHTLVTDMRTSDPVFILRQQQHLQSAVSAPISRTARAWSPTEQALASKRLAQRRSQIDMVRSSSDPSVAPASEVEADGHPPTLPPSGSDAAPQSADSRSDAEPDPAFEQARRHEMIAAQRAKARALALQAAAGAGTMDAASMALSGPAAASRQLSSPPGEQVPPHMEDAEHDSEHDSEDDDNIDAILNQVMQEADGTPSEATPRQSRDPEGFASMADMTVQDGSLYDGGHATEAMTEFAQVQPLRLRRSESNLSSSLDVSATGADANGPPVSGTQGKPTATTGTDGWELLAEPSQQGDSVPVSAATSVLDVPGAYRSLSPSPAPSPSPISNRALTAGALAGGTVSGLTSAEDTDRAPSAMQATPAKSGTPDVSGAGLASETARSISNPVLRTASTPATGNQTTPSAGSGSISSRDVVSPAFASPAQSSTTSPITSRMAPVVASAGAVGQHASSLLADIPAGAGASAAPALTATGKTRSGSTLGAISLDHLYAVMDAAARPPNRPGSAVPFSRNDSRRTSRSGVRASRVPEPSTGYWSRWSDGIWPDVQAVKAEKALQLCGRDGSDVLLVHLFAPSLRNVVSVPPIGGADAAAPAVSPHYLQMDKQLSQVDHKLDQLLADALRLP